MRKYLIVFLVALLCAAPGLGLLHMAVSAPPGGDFQADAVSAASPNYRVFTETDLKSITRVDGTLEGGHYTCQKNSPPYSYFEQDWEGVDLQYLLEQEVGLKAGTTGFKIIAADGYAVTLSMQEMQGNLNPMGLKTLLGYMRGQESAYNPGAPNGAGAPFVAPVAPSIEIDADEGPFRLVMPQSAIGPDARNTEYNAPAGTGDANWQKAVRQVRAVEVQPVPPGIPALDPEAIPADQVVVYGNILNRHTFTVDQLKTINPFAGTYHYRKSNPTPPPAYFEEDHDCVGLALPYLLDDVLGLQATATDVKIVASDGYSRTFGVDEVRQSGPTGLQMLLCWNYDGADLGPEPGDIGPIYSIRPLWTTDPTETNNKYWIKNVRNVHVVDAAAVDPGPDPTQIPTDRIIVSGVADAGNIPNEWFLAEGCTGAGFETFILIQNPNPWPTDVIVDYMIEGEAMQTMNYDNVPAESRFTINVGSEIGEGKNVSARVEGYHGDSIVVERAMYWNGRLGGHCSGGIQQPMANWYLAEGATSSPFETWVLVENPNAADATVDFTLNTDAGEVVPPGLQDQVVTANSRRTFNLGDYVDTYEVSTEVSADANVVVERAMYWNDRSGGHCAGGVTGPGSEWYLAEGATSSPFETWVLVQNPGDTAVNIDMNLITDTGVVAALNDFPIPANSRETFNLLAFVDTYNVSTMVEADGFGVIVERAMYWNDRKGGHCETANDHGKFHTYLAEGATAGGFETWLLFQNPGTSDATVYLTYLTDAGPMLRTPFVVEAGKRVSMNAFDDVGESYNVSVAVDATAPLVVERAVYWNGRIEGSCAKGLSAW